MQRAGMGGGDGEGSLSCGIQALGHVGLSTHSIQTQLPRGVWNPPGPGIKPMTSAVAGELPTTGPPGKFCFNILIGYFL